MTLSQAWTYRITAWLVSLIIGVLLSGAGTALLLCYWESGSPALLTVLGILAAWPAWVYLRLGGPEGADVILTFFTANAVGWVMALISGYEVIQWKMNDSQNKASEPTSR
jgi:hypothetical protein